jgi:hypothetical protein
VRVRWPKCAAPPAGEPACAEASARKLACADAEADRLEAAATASMHTITAPVTAKIRPLHANLIARASLLNRK